MQSSSTPIGIHVAAIPVAQVVPVVFFLIFFIWAVYTVVAAYHWLRYSNNTTLALCAITTHLIVSAWLAIYAVSGIS
ncbi:MAG: hypothetical protein ACM3TU_03485 [Bacillota bacterium]